MGRAISYPQANVASEWWLKNGEAQSNSWSDGGLQKHWSYYRFLLLLTTDLRLNELGVLLL